MRIWRTGYKNENATIPEINSVNGTGRSDEEGNKDITVVANQAVI